MGNILIKQDCLRSAIESKGSQNNTEWDSYFNCHAETSIRLQNSKMATLKESPQKTNEKLENKKFLKQKTLRLPASASWGAQGEQEHSKGSAACSLGIVAMPQKFEEIKDFQPTDRKKDAKCVKIKKNKDNVKLKV